MKNELAPIFKVQNGTKIDLHRKDYAANRELTVACNLENDMAADEIVTRFNSHDALVDALIQAIARVQLANEEGNTILSAWLPVARAALKLAEGKE